MKACVVKLLLWAPLIAGFAPLWRAPTRVTKTPSVHQLASSLSDDNDVNETDKIPDSAKYVIDTERGLDQEFEAFGAFLSGNETDPPLPPNDEDDSATVFTNESPTALWTQLLSIASRTGRGEFASKFDKATAMNIIRQLESENPTLSPADSSLMLGTWELVYSSTQLFRSSPFFMAGRAVCQDGRQAEQYDWFCDMHRAALAVSNIGAVRQVVNETSLVSEFEVKVGAVPFIGAKWPFSYSGGLPVSEKRVVPLVAFCFMLLTNLVATSLFYQFTIDGAIVSSADISPVNNSSAWEIYMDTVAIKGSNIPGLRQALDGGLNLSSRGLASVLESTVSSYTTPKPIFTTTYLDENLRISRDQDDKVFVYTKVCNSTTPTDYSNVMPDLGVSKLLEGFNDAVTKFYL